MKEIFDRRSVRSFTNQEVTKEQISLLLNAAMRAPSAGNEQPWEFIVIKDRENMEKIIEFHPYAKMLNEADCTIVICGNTKLQKYDYDFWIQDCAASTQNLLLEATHLGLGSVWLGIYPIEERYKGLQELCNLPDYIIPFSAIAIGYPKVQPKPLDTYREERIHYEKYLKK